MDRNLALTVVVVTTLIAIVWHVRLTRWQRQMKRECERQRQEEEP